MASVFLNLLNRSIAAGWLILAVLLLRLLPVRVPKSLRCMLWGLVGIRLICPFSFESVLSLIPSSETVPAEIFTAQAPMISNGIPAFNQTVSLTPAGMTAPAADTGVNLMQTVVFTVSNLWLAGFLAMLIYMVISFQKVRRQVAASLCREENIWICDHLDSPFILGILHPRIYLPSALDAAQSEYVIAHEKAHLQRKDHWWKPLGFLLLAVYWFHPLCWMAYILLCRDIELACDERVIRQMGPQEKVGYSQVLLSCSAPHRRMMSACPLAFGEVGVGRRVESVLRYKKPTFWIVLAAVVVCAVIAVCFLTDPYTQELRMNGMIYRQRGAAAAELPEEYTIIGKLQGDVIRTSEEPQEDFQATNLDQRYAGSLVWGSQTGEIVYLSDADGHYLPFVSVRQAKDDSYRAADDESTVGASGGKENTEMVSGVYQLDEENAAQTIQAILESLLIDQDGGISFRMPEKLPVDPNEATELAVTLNLTYRTDSGSFRVESLLDRKTSWQEGEEYTGRWKIQQEELTEVMLRVSFDTLVSEDRYQTFSAGYIQLKAPFTYNRPITLKKADVQIEEDGGRTSLIFTAADGTQAELSLALPQGVWLVREGTQETSGVFPTLSIRKDGKVIGSLTLSDYAASDPESLALAPASTELPMQIYAGVALGNHVDYHSGYRVVSSNATGSAAVCRMRYQDLKTLGDTAAAELPWQEADCVMAFDLMSEPYFLLITLNPDQLTADQLSEIARSVIFEVR